MKKRLAAFLAALVVLLAALPAMAAQSARVFDRAGLFSTLEEEALEKEIAAFQEKTGMDFVIVTSSEKHGDSSQQQIADAFYDQGGFGLDEENSGILYYIDMYERYHYLSTTGQMIDYMTDERIDSAIDTCKSYLSRGDYAGAASRMISVVENYVNRGIPEGQYRYDVVTGQRLTARHKALTSGEMLACAVIAAAVGLIFVATVQSRYKLKGSTYAYNFRENCGVQITGSADDYLRTTTTRTRRAPPPSGGQGGGFSGGSGVHTSGGTSHGGGGGHF